MFPGVAVRAATFLALVLAFPCPWYMFAVGGLLPLPVIVRYGLDGGKLNRNAYQAYSDAFGA
jgi:hypothetical protein